MHTIIRAILITLTICALISLTPWLIGCATDDVAQTTTTSAERLSAKVGQTEIAAEGWSNPKNLGLTIAPDGTVKLDTHSDPLVVSMQLETLYKLRELVKAAVVDGLEVGIQTAIREGSRSVTGGFTAQDLQLLNHLIGSLESQKPKE